MRIEEEEEKKASENITKKMRKSFLFDSNL